MLFGCGGIYNMVYIAIIILLFIYAGIKLSACRNTEEEIYNNITENI
jgi:hypothetical protein